MCQVDQIISYITFHSSQVIHCFNLEIATRQLNIKNRSYYFYNDLINILNFEASNLKLDKKTSLGLDIY